VIVLDTNVLSELLRDEPNALVMEWMDAHSTAELFTTTVSQSELLYGVLLLPEGKRKARLQAGLNLVFSEDFAERVLPFDQEATGFYAQISAHRRHRGHPISQFDAMIAAIARSRGARLATRNEKDFVDCGIVVVNPWQWVQK
jgi:predicted nucleic acid-binding protein